MFFGKKELENKVVLLEDELKKLKNQLEQKDRELVDLSRKHSIELEEISKKNQKSCEIFKEIASFSQEEGLAVFDENNKLFFANSLSKSHIKDFTIIIDAVLNGQDRIILDECESNLQVKTFENYKIVSLRKTSIHYNKEGGLLSRHNNNMTKSLSDTQNTYLSLLEELQEMQKESKETASGSTSGLDLINEIVVDTDNLYKEIENENIIVESLVSKSKDIAQVINI